MRTTSDVIDLLFDIVNVPVVTSEIDGEVYKGKKSRLPDKVDLQNIVILSLPIDNGDTQHMTAIINCFCIDYKETGTRNETKLKDIAEIVTTQLENYTKTRGTYFQFKIVSQNIMSDFQQKNMSYNSIRLNCNIEN